MKCIHVFRDVTVCICTKWCHNHIACFYIHISIAIPPQPHYPLILYFQFGYRRYSEWFPNNGTKLPLNCLNDISIDRVIPTSLKLMESLLVQVLAKHHGIHINTCMFGHMIQAWWWLFKTSFLCDQGLLINIFQHGLPQGSAEVWHV